MLLFAAAIAASALPSSRPATPAVVAEATVTVRIVSGVSLKLDSATNADAPRAHDSKVKAGGKLQPARLIEFE